VSVRYSDIADYARSEFSAEVSAAAADLRLNKPATVAGFGAQTIAFAKSVDAALQERAAGLSDAVLVVARDAADLGCPTIRVDNPRLAFAQIVETFFVERAAPGIHPTAVIHPSSEIADDVAIGAYCVIGPRCSIGARTVLHSHVTLSRDIEVGEDCVLWSHCVLGEDGFGIERRPGKLQKRMPHLGGVKLGNGVHIGNFTSIVGGTIEPTFIDDGSMIDNLVHIAHNVQIGKNCQVIACAEVSGSVRIGDNATIAPNASVIQKVTIGENSLLGIGAVATKSVPANVIAAGVPARVVRQVTPEQS
jgi:UDP-3-O-[3-hydroxymyristoyl] glucosamine N-acyltransferase